MSSLIFVSTVLALCLYVPLCIQLFKGKVKQNLATWLLWATLDGVIAATLVVQHGNYFLPVAYTLGSGITVLFILRSRSFKWTWFENFVAVLVVVCIIIWASAGSKIATVAATMAMVTAGIPQLIETYRKPWETPVLIYFGYTIANWLSVLGGHDWSIQERFNPACATIYTLAIVILGLRRPWLKTENYLPLMSSERRERIRKRAKKLRGVWLTK